MATPLKAIETAYAGCRFRSRLEARWAVFFDNLGIAWEYEPQGYRVGLDDTNYLPDFYLPKSLTWVEVKGEFTPKALATIIKALDYGHGLPGTANALGSERGILLLGPIPRVDDQLPIHPIFIHHKGVIVEGAMFLEGCLHGGSPYCDSYFSDCGQGQEEIPNGFSWPNQFSGRIPAKHQRAFEAVRSAYVAARSARFEHGETPSASRPFDNGYLLASRLAAQAVIIDDYPDDDPEDGAIYCRDCGADENVGSHGLCLQCWNEGQ